MTLNIKLRYSDTAEASAVTPVEFEVINDDCLPVAFKLNTKHPQRYVTNVSHGIVQPKKAKTIYLRLRPPFELKEKESAAGSQPVSILKSSAKTRPSDAVSLLSSSGTSEGAEIVRIEIRVITGVLADPTTEADFEKFWPSGFHHSTHMIPFKTIFLSEDDYFSVLLSKQEEQLKAVENERRALIDTVDAHVRAAALIEDRNVQFTTDLVHLRQRTAAALALERKMHNRFTIPTWVGVFAIAAAWYSAVSPQVQ